ncbi:MAG: HU family DNA-binding protein [Granulicatella sp.]|nr:HU family DNA-binding protein [Granulicatella sp.]
MSKYTDHDLVKMISSDTGTNEIIVELILKDLFTKIVQLAEEDHKIQFREFGTFFKSSRKIPIRSQRTEKQIYSLGFKTSEVIKKKYRQNQ